MGETENRIAGIDLGTTYSCIACMDDMDRPEVIGNKEGTLTTPSVVRLMPGKTPVVGATAKETSEMYPEYTIQFVKSRIGMEKSFEYGPEDNRLTTTPADVSAEILKKVVRDAEEYSNSKIKDVVITVPAYFGVREKTETKSAGEKAGLNVIGIVEEPTAAAFYYGIQKSSENETICIFDLGGGTFDVTAMKINNNDKVITVLTTDGNHDLGGKNWDEELIDLVKRKFEEETGSDGNYDSETEQKLILDCEKIKVQLTSSDSAEIPVRNGSYKAVIKVTRDEFDAATVMLLDSAIELTKAVFERTKSYGEDITKLLLVGGSTYMPQVRERLEKEFADIAIEINEPNVAVAKGACIYAKEYLTEHVLPDPDPDPDPNPIEKNRSIPGWEFEDVAKKSYGIKAYDINNNGEKIFKIFNLIKKDTKLEVSKTETFKTDCINQTSVSIELFENEYTDESIDVESGNNVANAVLSGIPKTGKIEKIDLKITMNKDGLIIITGELSDNHMPLEGDLTFNYNEDKKQQ